MAIHGRTSIIVGSYYRRLVGRTSFPNSSSRSGARSHLLIVCCRCVRGSGRRYCNRWCRVGFLGLVWLVYRRHGTRNSSLWRVNNKFCTWWPPTNCYASDYFIWELNLALPRACQVFWWPITIAYSASNARRARTASSPVRLAAIQLPSNKHDLRGYLLSHLSSQANHFSRATHLFPYQNTWRITEF